MEHDACALGEIPENGKKLVTVGNTKVLLLRKGERLYAVDNRCPHMKKPLSIVGKWDGTHITCRLHRARFDVRTGSRDKKAWLLGNMGDDKLHCYDVTVADGRVKVTL